MKKSVLLCLLGLAVCLFTACSSGNDEITDNPNPPTVSGKRISSIFGEGASAHDFTYDEQGRIISFKETFTEEGKTDSADNSYSYSNNSIAVRRIESDGFAYSYTYTLNSDKKVTKVLVTYGNSVETCEYAYDGNGQLVSISANDGSQYDYTLSWHNGNITTVVCKETYRGNISQNIVNYTYTSNPTNGLIGIDNAGVASIPDHLDPILFMQGYFGAYPKKTVSTYKSSEDNSTITVKYEVNSQGYVTKLSKSNGESHTITWE